MNQPRPRSRRAAIIAFLVLGAAVLALRLSSVRVDILNEDEALYATTAAAMATGEPIYRAGVESKPPGIFYLYEAGFAVVGRYNMRGLHALTIPWVFAAGIFVGLIAGELTGRRRWWLGSPPFVAALFYYGFTIVQEPQVFATQCEIVYTLPLAAAAWLILRTARRNGWLGLLAAGALIGLGTLVKPTAVSLLLAGGAWLALVRPFAHGERFGEVLPARQHSPAASPSRGSQRMSGSRTSACGTISFTGPSAGPWASTFPPAPRSFRGWRASPSISCRGSR